ncbi:MAG TPA: hypothetical protein VLI07_18760 [Candidatus Binatus sp.]|nr:hypothetical protein [Candidatus Binatus sp.]
MTRKDFELIAAVVNGYARDREDGGLLRDRLAESFIARLRHENPRFDEERFYDACTTNLVAERRDAS